MDETEHIELLRKQSKTIASVVMDSLQYHYHEEVDPYAPLNIKASVGYFDKKRGRLEELVCNGVFTALYALWRSAGEENGDGEQITAECFIEIHQEALKNHVPILMESFAGESHKYGR